VILRVALAPGCSPVFMDLSPLPVESVAPGGGGGARRMSRLSATGTTLCGSVRARRLLLLAACRAL